ncbi:hypothetical protein H257_01922 [Aphanomyces astaci]|uniref:PWWP domain-containing protein n=1 Tax=Aphanomyces astaci TaxID=112090 RepID=W4H6Y3_APHAT|nr:hypothetical protein H257_01922 [Aphanomyces astaci]ETV86878.1 hypothetical protein H257_01922 [Aphanomyces astaci]|eukprot:XP_009823677.1 hypothetical protein H257_01922 [Aphanomyces astaci]
MVAPPLDYVGWGLLRGYPWWPLYLLDPAKISPLFKATDGKFQDILAQAKASPKPQRLAYYFGSHDFGLHKATQVKPWLHSQHLAYTKGFPSRACSDDQTALLLSHAVREATDFVVTDPAERVLPELTSADYNFAGNHVAVVPFKKAPRVVTIVVDSDDDVPTTSAPSSPSPPALTNNGNIDRRRRKTIVPRVSTPEPRKRWLGESVALKQVPVNSVCWAKTEVFVDPWLPVFVCNPSELDPGVQNLGRVNARILEIAATHPRTISVVYYFGARTFGVIKSKGQIEPWNGANHDAYLYQTWLDDEDLDGVALGVEDAEAFVASNSARPYESESENARISADKGDVWDDMGDDETYTNESGSDVDIAEPPLFPHNAVKVVEVATSSTPPTDELRSPIEPKRVMSPSPPRNTTSRRDDVIVVSRAIKKPCVDRSSPPRQLYEYLVIPMVTGHSRPRTSNAYLVWAKRKNCPWWPGYVCDPLRLRPHLFLLGRAHKVDLDIAKTNQDVFKLVYFFGRHDLGRQHATRHGSLKPWNGPDHETLACGPPPVECNVTERTRAQFQNAMAEVKEFLATSAVTRVLPYMVPSDLDPDVTEPEVPLLPKECLVWALTKDHPWMPGYLCDPWGSPKKLAGRVPQQLVITARQQGPNCWLVYYFGLHSFVIHSIRGTLKLWKCDDHESLLQGYAESPVADDSIWNSFMDAVDEVKYPNNSIAGSRGRGGMQGQGDEEASAD